MRKSWPFAVAVIVVGGLAGIAIAGRPTASDPFVLDPSITVVSDTTPSTEPASTTSTTVKAVTTTTVVPTATDGPTTSVADTTGPTTTVGPTTTAAPTSTTIAGPLPRNKVRLVIANGDGRFKLASTTGDRLAPLGYIIDLADALKVVDATVIYYRPGFDDEAEILAKDVGVPNAIVIAFPASASEPITDSDDRGDVIVVLGPDAPR